MGIRIQRNWRQQLLVVMMAGMLIALYTSRALLSICMMGFLALALFHPQWRQQLKDFFADRWLPLLTLLFLIPFVSGLWSSNTSDWAEVVRIKLPLLFFPIAFAGRWQLSKAQWRLLLLLFIALAILGCAWSGWQYLRNATAINESYLQAKSLPTPFANDHVRFSWVVAVAAALCLYHAWHSKWQRILLLVAAVLFFVYLHLLSARTGLLCFYFFLLAAVVQLMLQAQRKWAISLLVLLVAVPLLAWWLLPTFQNRLGYISYDLSFIKNKTYLPGGNDGNRMQSFKAGWALLQQHPLGVGAGDVRVAANTWYQKQVPGMLPSDQLLPSSEWLVYAGFAGWPGLFLFTVIVLFPLFEKIRYRWGWALLNGMAALSFMFDVGLEVQFGVFVYIFIVLCCRKFCRTTNGLSAHL